MSEKKIGIIMNGVTGRMGTNQHLIRSLLAIRNHGGLKLADGTRLMPEVMLMGRNEQKLAKLAEVHGLKHWTTDLKTVLADPFYEIYFDAQTTAHRVASVKQAIDAGKAVYCEKPVAETLSDGLKLAEYAERAGVKNGVVQDKLWLPGLLKLKHLIDDGFFGKILSVRGEFGYWVFDGSNSDSQRPSWNYRKEDGGSLVVDMFCHFRYVLDNLFGNVNAVSCLATTHVEKRWDEAGNSFETTADDAAYATFRLDNNIICQMNASWATRVRRDDLFTLHVDGTNGSAVAGLTGCRIQKLGETPRYIWNPDEPNGHDYFSAWQDYSYNGHFDNAFKVQWELFLKHYVSDEPFRWSIREGVKGLQLAEKALESSEKGAWIELERL